MAKSKLEMKKGSLMDRYGTQPAQTDAEPQVEEAFIPTSKEDSYGFDIPVGYKIVPIETELKSKQISAKITQSLYDEAKAESERLGMKFNAFIEYALRGAIDNGRR